ncbi:MAG: InlB B-repeat-containing protein [Phocaeicola sp.]
MFKLIKSMLLVLSGVLAMSSCSKSDVVEKSTTMSVTFLSGANGTVTPLGEQTGNEGSTLSSVAKADTSYLLKGWYDELGHKISTVGDVTIIGDSTLQVKLTAVTAGKTYRAKFQFIYSVIFESLDTNLGTVDNAGGTGNLGDTFVSIATAKENSFFDGWYDDDDNKVETGGDITVSGNKLEVILSSETGGRTYRAKFQPIYSVIFESSDTNKGTVDNPGGTGKGGDTIVSIATAIAKSYFLGWYDANNKKVETGGGITVSGNKLEVILSAETGNKTYRAKFLDGFIFTIKTTVVYNRYTLPFSPTSTTGAYDLTVDWGDGSELMSIPAKTFLSGIITHTYESSGEHIISIASSEEDFSKVQMPNVNWKSDNLLKSINSPLLNTAMTSFYGVFYECRNLTSIPSDLFKYNTAATSFRYAFYGCYSLTEIPAGLFKYNTAAINFMRAFYGCTRAKVNPNIFCNDSDENEKATRFNSLTGEISFERAFFNVGQKLGAEEISKSIFPALWDYAYSAATVTKTSCFSGAKASNEGAVGSGWK